jgi:hypothetical protein
VPGVFHSDISFIYSFRGHQSSSVVCGVFADEEVDGVGDKESGVTTTLDIHTLLEAFFNLSLGSARFTEKAFSFKKQNFLK